MPQKLQNLKLRILIHVDSVRRDAAPMLVLARLLESLGHKVAVSSRLTTPLYLRFWRPHHLVHGNPMQFVGLEETGLLGENGPRVSLVPQEGNERQDIVVHAYYEGMLGAAARRYVDCVFHWNQHHADWFAEKTQYSADQNLLVGNPRMDLCKFGGNKPRKESGRVGFVGRFPTINKYEYHRLTEHLACNRAKEIGTGTLLAEQIRIRNGGVMRQIANYIKYSEIIHRLMHNTDRSVSLRPHHEESTRCPGYLGLKQLYDGRFDIDSSLSIYHWAKSLDVIVSTSSLTFAEAYLAGTPVICVDRLTNVAGFFDQESLAILDTYGELYLPGTDEALMDSIQTLSDPVRPAQKLPDVEQYLATDFNYPYSGSVLARIARRIDASDRGRNRAPLMPRKAIEEIYWLQLLRVYGAHPRSGPDKDYHPGIHGVPDYIDAIVSNILSSDNAGVPDAAGPQKAA